MTPDERQLLSGLFDRIRGSSNQQRDREAQSFIDDAVRTQPYAPYLMAQTVIVQEQALRAANERLQQLEAQLREQQANTSQPQDTSFLGSIGRSIFGSGQNEAPNAGRPSVPTTGGFGPAPLPEEPHPFNRQSQGGPWGNQAQGGWAQQQPGPSQAGYAAAPAQGGGFLKGALGAAAGVAGGVLLADSIRGLFGGGHNPFGIASGMGGPGFEGGYGAPGGETIVNNYYDSPQPGADSMDPGSFDNGSDFGQGGSDDFGNDSFDPGMGGDDSYNV